jgi:superfamily II DNA/RNA helicase
MQDVETDQFLDFLNLYDLSLTYVNRKATGGNIAYGLNQTVSPRLDEPLVVDLLTGDNTMTEVGGVIERIERERNDTGEVRLDVLIATSLISHGVDLERINFLSMAGMPSRYAEYIQASSRAARNHVGLVLVCFKRFDLRERSQYHYFLPNHRYLDRLVEPVPINRFSAFAAQRTVPGLLAGLLLSYYSRDLFRRGVITKSLDNLRQLKQMMDKKEITIDQLKSDLEAIIGVSHPQLSALQKRYMVEEIDAVLQTNWDQISRSYDTFLGDAIRPMSSFRDVDETIDFVAVGATSVFVERVRS